VIPPLFLFPLSFGRKNNGTVVPLFLLK